MQPSALGILVYFYLPRSRMAHLGFEPEISRCENRIRRLTNRYNHRWIYLLLPSCVKCRQNHLPRKREIEIRWVWSSLAADHSRLLYVILYKIRWKIYFCNHMYDLLLIKNPENQTKEIGEVALLSVSLIFCNIMLLCN